VLSTNLAVLAVNSRTSEKLTAASEQGLKNTPPTKEVHKHIMSWCEHFQSLPDPT
jgi:hypothetical protein